MGSLTRSLCADPTGTLDLNKASESLQVQKRRFYDLTNILEGAGFLEKKSKNTVQRCGVWNHDLAAEHAGHHTDLEAVESKLDNPALSDQV